MSLGFRGGVNFANAIIEGVSLSPSKRTGMMLGGLIEINISDAISIQSEVLYVQKGAEFSVSVGGLSTTTTWKFNYIEFPILFKEKYGSSSFKPYIFFGPYLGLRLNAESEVKFGTQSLTLDLKNSTESTDFGLDIGLGGEYSVSEKTALSGDVRYSAGLSDIDKSSVISWRPTGIQILLGVKFGL